MFSLRNKNKIFELSSVPPVIWSFVVEFLFCESVHVPYAFSNVLLCFRPLRNSEVCFKVVNFLDGQHYT